MSTQEQQSIRLDRTRGDDPRQNESENKGENIHRNLLRTDSLPSLPSWPLLPLPSRHGCQIAIARFLNCMCLALCASGLWLRYATPQNLMPSFPWIAPPHALHPGAIQGKEGIKFCHLAALVLLILRHSLQADCLFFLPD